MEDLFFTNTATKKDKGSEISLNTNEENFGFLDSAPAMDLGGTSRSTSFRDLSAENEKAVKTFEKMHLGKKSNFHFISF